MLKSKSTVMCLVVVCLCTGYTAGRLHFNGLLEERMVEAYQLGYMAGKQVDWKVVLKSDQAAANKACNLWWFGMNGSERKLDKRLR